MIKTESRPLQRLIDAEIPQPQRDLAILQQNFSGEALLQAIEKRVARKPMAQILGFRDFWKDRFFVNEHVLDPRPDSEVFLEIAMGWGGAIERILDLGTGSGALGLSALREFPHATLVLADISSDALEVSKANAKSLGLFDQCQFVQSNWFENTSGQYDLILCNPPYLTAQELENAQAELKYEPEAALSDHADGFTHYRVLAQHLNQFLAPNGVALFEHGYTQQNKVTEIFQSNGFSTKKHQDLSGNPRIVAVFNE